jgi:hypothetical protein
MGTLKGFPTPPALWLRQAKPASAYAIFGFFTTEDTGVTEAGGEEVSGSEPFGSLLTLCSLRSLW